MKSIDSGVILCKNISGLFLYLKYVGAQRLCRDKKAGETALEGEDKREIGELGKRKLCKTEPVGLF